uniref:NAD-specific glutamate dehydrogenase n=1 Tax=Steinernema glaseri TaxID=37863 RepID=A0A1I7YRE6_9BILA
MGGNLVEGGQDRLVDGQIVLDAVALLVLLAGQRPVPGLDRVGTPGHLDDRRIVEVPGKALQVDGRGGDDDLEVGAPRQQGLEVAEQEVDVQAAFVGFVDDDRVVAFQKAVVLGFGQQDAVGHQLDQGVGIALVFEAHLVADQRAQRRTQLFG